jgi:hypothetical protein
VSNLSVNTITDEVGTGSPSFPNGVAVTGSINGLTPQASNMQPHNLIINGAMNIWQRGETFSAGTSALYTCDRFKTNTGSAFNYDATITKSTDVPSGSGFQYSAKIDVDTTQTPTAIQNGGFGTALEKQDVMQLAYGTSNAKTVTVSFWVKSNKTGIYSLQFQQNAQGGTGYNYIAEYTISSSGVWEYKTITIAGNTLQTFDGASGNYDALKVLFWHAVGSDDYGTVGSWFASTSFLASANQVNLFDSVNNYWQITGVQLEAGSTASSFAHENVGDTLRKCQRYYQLITAETSDAQTRPDRGLAVTLIPEMRTGPSVVRTGNAISSQSDGTVATNISPNNLVFVKGSTGYGVGGRFKLDAEL